jgi:hypothetical protein
MDEIPYSKTYDYQKVYIKRYQEKNRTELLAKRRRRIICHCGCNISLSSIYRHLDSQRHKEKLFEISTLYIAVNNIH